MGFSEYGVRPLEIGIAMRLEKSCKLAILGIPRNALHGDCTTNRASVFKPCQKAVYVCSGLLRRRRLVMHHFAPQRSADDLHGSGMAAHPDPMQCA